MERGGSLPGIVQRNSYLGDSSYSLYLMHALLIGVLLKAYGALFSLSPYFRVFAGLLLTVLCIVIAIAFYQLVERRVVSSLQTAVRNIQKLRTTQQAS